ncbi:MAG TPA: hypothetical protein VIL43_10120 [Burkholderiales bacterium]
MDDYEAIERRQRMRDIRSHAVAFLMLAVSLFALYTQMLYLALIPMFWLVFKAGKEKGREEAQRDLEEAIGLHAQRAVHTTAIEMSAASEHRLR